MRETLFPQGACRYALRLHFGMLLLTFKQDANVEHLHDDIEREGFPTHDLRKRQKSRRS